VNQIDLNMKKIVVFLVLALSFTSTAQIQRPMASPLAKVEQKVGLTDIKIEYFRPSKNNRTIFGDVVPFGEMWRTGANENTKFTTPDPLVFGKDTLKAGTYAIFTTPNKDNWEVIFYAELGNWGTPDNFDETKVALRRTVPVIALNDVTETFTISIDNPTTDKADLTLSWDKTRVALSFNVPTAAKMSANIDKVMAGPSANDYYASAEFYFKEKKDMKKALEWINKAIEIRGQEAFWMLRLKSQIQAELGDYKGAIETAKLSLAAAEKAEYKSYIDANKAAIEEWSKKKK
jgi:tetratricopeptide (TPR) repeat protein